MKDFDTLLNAAVTIAVVWLLIQLGMMVIRGTAHYL